MRQTRGDVKGLRHSKALCPYLDNIGLRFRLCEPIRNPSFKMTTKKLQDDDTKKQASTQVDEVDAAVRLSKPLCSSRSDLFASPHTIPRKQSQALPKRRRRDLWLRERQAKPSKQWDLSWVSQACLEENKWVGNPTHQY